MTAPNPSARKAPVKVRARRFVKAVERVDRTLANRFAVNEQSMAGRLIGRFAELGDQPPMQYLSGAVITAGAIRRNRRLLRAGLRMLGAHSIATLAKAFIKDNVDRTRPGEAIDHDDYRLTAGTSQDHNLQSMPSGHSAGVVAVVGSAIVEYPAVTWPAAIGAAALVGSQLPSRNHYLSDVAIGSALGLMAFGLMRSILPPLVTDGGRVRLNRKN